MIDTHKSYFLATLGCSKNEIDSERIESNLLAAGMNKADDPSKADLIIVNSCGFIIDAKIESIDTALTLHRDRRKGSVLVMAGCLPARYQLKESLGEVDLYLPSAEHDRLVPYLKSIGWELGAPDSAIGRLKPNVPFGYLKISEGCDNRCTYCAIPDIKGSFVSRKVDDIVREADYLCSNGVRELVLIGQDTTLYGQDLEHDNGLADLIGRLSGIMDCRWIRLMYAHPAHLDDRVIEILASNEKTVKYIDLPLQHINSRILKLMNRRIDRQKVESLLKRLRRDIPGLVLRTTFIVGFPGETDNEFGELLDFCEGFRFENVGAFKYSPEDGTPAEKFSGRNNDQTIEERYLTLLDLQNNISGDILKTRVGEKGKVLIHEINSDRIGFGRAWFQAPEVDGQVIIERCSAVPGDFADVEYVGADAYDLFAEQVKTG